MKKIIPFALISAFTAACSDIPPGAYFNRGTPESLLDMNSEAVNINIGEPAGLDELVSWMNQDAPSRAELYCVSMDPACARAKDALRQFDVKYTQSDEPRNTVSLFYEHMAARDCENRFIDNSINPYNLNHPTFGCSVAANIVQSVPDKRQFVNPALKGDGDAESAVRNFDWYRGPAK